MSTRLPAAAVLLSYMLLAAFTTLSYVNLRSSSQGGGALVRTKDSHYLIPRNKFLVASVTGAGEITSRTVQAINLPGMFGEVVASMVTRTWPNSWRPPYFGASPYGLFIWRSFCFPIYCLPFWGFAGMGLDALFGRRRLRWPTLLIGTLLCALLIVLAAGLIFSLSSEDHVGLSYVFWGFGLWIALLASFPAAWIRQPRLTRTNTST